MKTANEFKYVCICGSAYALLQYLLLQEEVIIKAHTYYFVGSGVNKEIARNLPHYTQFDTTPCHGLKKILRIVSKIRLRWFGMMHFPFLRTACIYAQDYMYPIIVIKNRPYIMLQESPHHMTVNYGADSQDLARAEAHLHSFSGRLERALYGDVLLFPPAATQQCQQIELTEKNESPLLEGKIFSINSFVSLWRKAPETKKKYIREIFNLNRNEEFPKAKNVFLTQPLVDDKILSDAEYKKLLDEIFNKYSRETICIKIHPRDTYNYTNNFPNIQLFRTKTNIELLFLLGWKCERIISICSTAVNSIPETIEVDWFGAKVHPKLESYFGTTIIPYRPYKQMKL